MFYNTTVSVIVPCFNSENTIIKCLNSLCNQTRPFFEIIIVNDGSKDRTEELVLEFSQNNKIDNIFVFSINNSGVAYARNFGISKSKGNYIAFVDSDDFVEPTFCETLVFPFETNSKCDLSICSVLRDSNVNDGSQKKYFELDIKQLLEKIVNSLDVQGYLCNKLFRADIIKSKKLVLDTNLHIGEDLDFILQYCQHVRKASFCTSKLYHYLDNNSSATNAMFKTNSLNLLHKLDRIKGYVLNSKTYPDIIEAKLTTIALWLLLKYYRSRMVDNQVEHFLIIWLRSRRKNYVKNWYRVYPRKYIIVYLIWLVSPKLIREVSKIKR